MKIEFSRQIFEKYSNIRFHGNSSGGSRVVPCGRTDEQTGRQRRTHMTKHIVAICSFANTAQIHKLKRNIMFGEINGYVRLVRNCFAL